MIAVASVDAYCTTIRKVAQYCPLLLVIFLVFVEFLSKIAEDTSRILQTA